MVKMKSESEHAISKDMQSLITIEKNIYFFLPRRKDEMLFFGKA